MYVQLTHQRRGRGNQEPTRRTGDLAKEARSRTNSLICYKKQRQILVQLSVNED